MRGGESFGERILREMLENITGKETYMDTKDFDARNEEKSRSVCERIHAEHAGRELSERERQILDMWPRFEDTGEPVMVGDAYVDTDGDDNIVAAVRFDRGCADLVGAEGLYTGFDPGERVKRPAPKVVDADGVEIKVGDTVWHHSGFAHGVVTSIDVGSLMGTVRYVNGGVEFRDAAKDLAHTRPDSWERLEEDTMKGSCAYFGFADKPCSDGDGCPANKPGDCAKFKAVDIVRRAKALAGVEVSE